MKNKDNILLGVILILVGLLLGGKTLGLININLFFKGWWTLFIIIPSFIGLFNDKDKTGSIIGLLIGIMLLLSSRGIFAFDIIWKLIFPIIIIIFGLSLIFKNSFKKEINDKIIELNGQTKEDNSTYACFSHQDLKYDDEEFKKTELNAIFGGIKLDLRNAKIKDDVIINASSIFGGIDIYVPEGIKLKIKSNSFFGGVSDNRKEKEKEAAKTIYLNATCMFGGVSIK